MYKKARNNPKLQLQKPKVIEPSSSIHEMSISLLNEIDKKYESMSQDHYQQRKPRNSKASTSVSSNSYSDQRFKTQSSIEKLVPNQKVKQNKKLQEIQQNYQNFQQRYSTQKGSNADKENIQLNTDSTKSEDEINRVISCLEQRFFGQEKNIQHQTFSTESQYRETISQLQNRDASLRLDLTKVKKQNVELREKYQQAMNRIAELEKIQKRDNDYIIKMDNNMMMMKQKLTQIQSQKQNDQEKMIQLQSRVKELSDENIYLQQLLQQHIEAQQVRMPKFRTMDNLQLKNMVQAEQPKKQKFIVKNSTFQSTNSEMDEQLINSLWQPSDMTIADYSSPASWQAKQCFNNQQLNLSTPSIKLDEIVKVDSIHQNTRTNKDDDQDDLEMTIQNLVSQLDEEQADQIYNLFNEIRSDCQKTNQILTKNEIYERLNEKIMSMHSSNAFLEHYEIHKNTLDKRSDRGSFQCTSQLSNFSFAQNSDRRKVSKQEESGINNDMLQQILSLNAQLTQQINLQKISKEQANQFINYLQDQITNTPSADYFQDGNDPNDQQVEE